MKIDKKLVFWMLLVTSVSINVVVMGVFIYRKVYVDIIKPQRVIRIRWAQLLNARPDTAEIDFVGTSLTQSFPLRNCFTNLHIRNVGFGDAGMQQILANTQKIVTRKPQKLFLEGGINDLRRTWQTDTAYKYFVQTCRVVKRQSPGTRLYVQSVLPTFSRRLNVVVKAYNARISQYCRQNGITYIDVYMPLAADDQLNALAARDGIHLTLYGYHLWQKVLEPYLAQ